MRFITEFELLTRFEIENYKSIRAFSSAQMLGVDISKLFGWQEKNNGPDTEIHTLEIEAFPMDKWIEFKQELNVLLSNNCTSWATSEIYKMIEELESFVR